MLCLLLPPPSPSVGNGGRRATPLHGFCSAVQALLGAISSAMTSAMTSEDASRRVPWALLLGYKPRLQGPRILHMEPVPHASAGTSKEGVVCDSEITSPHRHYMMPRISGVAFVCRFPFIAAWTATCCRKFQTASNRNAMPPADRGIPHDNSLLLRFTDWPLEVHSLTSTMPFVCQKNLPANASRAFVKKCQLFTGILILLGVY
jgi:hypothetical protein